MNHIKEFHITDTGLDALQAAETVITETEKRVYDALGTERFEQLRSLLDAVIEALTPAPGPQQ